MKKTISLFCIFFILIGCQKENNVQEIEVLNKIEILNIDNKEILNQMIVYKNDTIDYSKSQFYKIENNCIRYYSFFDTLDNKLGENRYIVFKTSNLLKSDFSNADSLDLREFFFHKKNSLCLDEDLKVSYGIIEDIIFLETDSIVNGERQTRIKTSYQYIKFNDSINWIER